MLISKIVAGLIIGFVVVNVSAEEVCRLRGTAPICEGECYPGERFAGYKKKNCITGKKALCCAPVLPITPENCVWRGTAPLCKGACSGGGEFEQARTDSAAKVPSSFGDGLINSFGAVCVTGTKALCCSAPGGSSGFPLNAITYEPTRRQPAGFAATRNKENLNVLWQGNDGSIWIAYWDPGVEGQNPIWPAYQVTNPNSVRPAGSIVAPTRSMENLDAFWEGNDGAIWTAYWNPKTKSGHWPAYRITNTNIMRPLGSLTATTRTSENLDVFWEGSDGAIWTAYWNPQVKAGQWPVYKVTGNNSVRSDGHIVALSRSNDNIDLFWEGNDGAIWTAYWNPSIKGSWPVYRISNQNIIRKGATIAAVSRTSENIDVFWVGNDGAIWTAYWNPQVKPGQWPVYKLTGDNSVSKNGSVTATARSSDNIDLFWEGNDGAIWTAYWNPTVKGPWPLYRISNQNIIRKGAAIAALSRTLENIDVYWEGNDGAIWTAYWNPLVKPGQWPVYRLTSTNSVRKQQVIIAPIRKKTIPADSAVRH